MNKEELKPNYDAPFPQADNFEILISTLKMLEDGKTLEDWIAAFDYHQRQFHYYFNALKWLGFTKGKPAKPKVTDLGRNVLNETSERRGEKILEILKKDPVFAETMLHKPSMMLNIASGILYRNDPNMSSVTVTRRAQTIKSWIKELDNFK